MRSFARYGPGTACTSYKRLTGQGLQTAEEACVVTVIIYLDISVYEETFYVEDQDSVVIHGIYPSHSKRNEICFERETIENL